uniref:Uncharacterized protein n=1 Tax=Knipowitschia caucasica TaxID=637954 RepID=A0AAV2M613_KNICA
MCLKQPRQLPVLITRSDAAAYDIQGEPSCDITLTERPASNKQDCMCHSLMMYKRQSGREPGEWGVREGGGCFCPVTQTLSPPQFCPAATGAAAAFSAEVPSFSRRDSEVHDSLQTPHPHPPHHHQQHLPPPWVPECIVFML